MVKAYQADLEYVEENDGFYGGGWIALALWSGAERKAFHARKAQVPKFLHPAIPLSTKHHHRQHTAMEEDRDATDIGIAVEAELRSENEVEASAPLEDVSATKKEPKRRFVGRRAANEQAANRAASSNGIEESGAIQGAF